MGFESGGLAVAHSLTQGYTAVPVVHDNYLHREMVAMGLLAQLVAEENLDEPRRVALLFASLGLSVNLEQISLGVDRSSELGAMLEVAMDFPFVQNLPFELSHERLLQAVIDAHELGVEVAAREGDGAYRQLHSG